MFLGFWVCLYLLWNRIMFMGLFIFDEVQMFTHCAQIFCGETLKKFPLDHSLGKNLN